MATRPPNTEGSPPPKKRASKPLASPPNDAAAPLPAQPPALEEKNQPTPKTPSKLEPDDRPSPRPPRSADRFLFGFGAVVVLTLLCLVLAFALSLFDPVRSNKLFDKLVDIFTFGAGAIIGVIGGRKSK